MCFQDNTEASDYSSTSCLLHQVARLIVLRYCFLSITRWIVGWLWSRGRALSSCSKSTSSFNSAICHHTLSPKLELSWKHLIDCTLLDCLCSVGLSCLLHISRGRRPCITITATEIKVLLELCWTPNEIILHRLGSELGADSRARF